MGATSLVYEHLGKTFLIIQIIYLYHVHIFPSLVRMSILSLPSSKSITTWTPTYYSNN